MSITNCKHSAGLQARFTPSSQGASGSLILGNASSTRTISHVDTGYVIRALVGHTATFSLELADGSTTGTDSWTAGAAQVETATVVGTITTAGNAALTVTATGMSGSPLAVPFAVALGDNASAIAAKGRAALAANSTISALFDVVGSGASVGLRRKPAESYVIGGTTYAWYYGNDSALNIAVADDTSAGITEAGTSANTTTGVATSGVKLFDGDGKDLGGEPLVAAAYFRAIRVQVESPAGSRLDLAEGSSLIGSSLPAGSDTLIRLPDVAGSGFSQSGPVVWNGYGYLVDVTVTFFGDSNV